MNNNHIGAGLFFITICLGIGVLMALAGRAQPSTNQYEVAAPTASMTENALVSGDAEPVRDVLGNGFCVPENRSSDGNYRPASGGVFILDGNGICREAPALVSQQCEFGSPGSDGSCPPAPNDPNIEQASADASGQGVQTPPARASAAEMIADCSSDLRQTALTSAQIGAFCTCAVAQVRDGTEQPLAARQCADALGISLAPQR